MKTPPSHAVKLTVRASYDQMADQYSSHVTMQTGNLEHLASLVREAADGVMVKRMLDVGCGDGRGLHFFQDLLSIETLTVGVDLSLELLRLGRDNLSLHHLIVGDAEYLPLPSSTFDLVISNSVLHWLNAPQHGLSPRDAVAEIARVLRPGGIVGVSIAGTGTARAFQDSYATVSNRYRSLGLLDEAVYRPDPIGSMPLNEVVDLFLGAGFVIGQAWLAYEPILYGRAEDYSADVAAYGFGPYTAAVEQSHRDQFFSDVTEQFVADSGAGHYLHDQYMVYLSGRLPD